MSLRRDRDRVLSEYAISRETAARLDRFVDEIERWQQIKNLVGRNDLVDLWPRHIGDSLQLLDLAPAGTWVDFGSGAGFPGMVAAIVRPDATMHLVESNNRKCAFLRQVAATVAPNAQVHAERFETFSRRMSDGVATISARAVASLDQLLDWSQSLLTKGAVGLFPKGQDVHAELTHAAESWKFDYDLIPSRTDSAARIIRVHHFGGPKSE